MSNESYGIVVWCDPSSLKARLWIFNCFEERVVEDLQCRLGEWFLCKKNSQFSPIEPKLETKVDDWKVEIKVPVVLCQNWTEDLGIKVSGKIENTLFSPIVGRIGIFLPTESYLNGRLYEAWITNIPDEQQKCKLLKEKLQIFWMVGSQLPTPYFGKEKESMYRLFNNEFTSCEGVVLKVICTTMIIVCDKIGLCFSPVQGSIGRGDRIFCLPVQAKTNQDSIVFLATNCTLLKNREIEILNEFDNEFNFEINVNSDSVENGEYQIVPYGTITDHDKLIKPCSVNMTLSVTIQFHLNIPKSTIHFSVKEVLSEQVDLSKLTEELANSKFGNDRNVVDNFDSGPSEFNKSCHSNNRYPPPPGFNEKVQNTKQTKRDGEKVIGIVAAQIAEGFYIYSPRYSRDVYMPKYLREFDDLNYTINVGQWICYVPTILSNSNLVVSSFDPIDPIFPTMPSYNTVMIECKIYIPIDYDAVRYCSTVESEFVPRVADQDVLIRKCHLGKTLSAIMRRTKTRIPGLFWNLEYIKL